MRQAASTEKQGLGVSIVTVTFNSRNDLLRSWSGFDPTLAEWIVVDNRSDDGSAEVAAGLGATVIDAGSNLGFSLANNLGAEIASGDVLVFCNPDVTVDEAGLRHLAERCTDDAGIIAPQLLNADGSLQENGRGTPFPHRKLLHMFTKRDPVHDPYLVFAGLGEQRDVVWAMGAAVAMHRRVFDRVGRWDGRYFIYYEDADICLRAHKAGVPVSLDGTVRWQHGWARETSKGMSLRAWRNEARSAMRFYASHPYCLLPVGRTANTFRAVERRSRARLVSS